MTASGPKARAWIGTSIILFLMLAIFAALVLSLFYGHERQQHLRAYTQQQVVSLHYAQLGLDRVAGEQLMDVNLLVAQLEQLDVRDEELLAETRRNLIYSFLEFHPDYRQAVLWSGRDFRREDLVIERTGEAIFSLDEDLPEWRQMLARLEPGVIAGPHGVRRPGDEPPMKWLMVRWTDRHGRPGALAMQASLARIEGWLAQQGVWLVHRSTGEIVPQSSLDGEAVSLAQRHPGLWAWLREQTTFPASLQAEAAASAIPLQLVNPQGLGLKSPRTLPYREGPDAWLVAFQPDMDIAAGERETKAKLVSWYLALLLLFAALSAFFGRQWSQYEFTQRLLRQERAFFRSLLDALPVPVFFKSREGRYQMVNQAMAEMFGRTIESLLGQSVESIAEDESLTQTIRDNERLIMSGQQTRLTFEVSQRNRNRMGHFIVHKTRLLDIAGMQEGILSTIVDVTEERALLSERNQIAERFRQMVAQIPGVLLQYQRLADGTERLLYCSDAASILFEASPAELYADLPRFWARVHPEERNDVRESLLASGRGLQEWYREFRVVHSSGLTWWLLGRARPRRLPDGSTIWDGFLSDMTKQKQAQLRAERDRDLIRSLFSSLTDQVSYKDIYGFYLGGNPAFARFVGYPAESLVGKRDNEVFSADYADSWRELERKVIAERRPIRHEEVVRSRSGRLVTLDMVRSPIQNRNGEIVGVLCIGRDVTERVQAENRLRELTQRFDAATRTGAIGVWEMELATGILVWNEVMFELYGVSPENFDLNAKTWVRYIHPEDRDVEWERIHQATPETHQLSLAYRIIRQDTGEVRHVRGECQLFWEGKALVRMLGTNWDVTLTVDAERKLIEAKDAAEQASRAKSEFLAVMSHEIRTPMNGVIGAASLMLQTPLDEQQRDYLRTIQISGENLLAILNDILDYSKIEAGRMELEAVPFDLQECVDDALDLFAVEASRKGLELAALLQPEVPLRWIGDITRLRQILVNLLSNGIKFTDAGQVSVHVGWDGSNVLIEVRDSGIGIPDDRKDRLFKSFTQIDASNTRRYGGTGLGLAISKRLAIAMGGDLDFRNNRDRGATFAVRVHLQAAEEQPVALETCCEPPENFTVWVLSENPMVGELWRQQAANFGVEARLFTKRADLVAQRTAPNAILVDAGVADWLHGTGVWSLCRRMILAAPPQSAAPSHLRQAHLVRKPVKPRQLWRALFECEGQRVEASVTHVPESAPETSELRVLMAEDNLINQRVTKMMLVRLGYEPMIVANGVEAVTAFVESEYDVILMDVQMPELDGLEATRRIRALSQDSQTPWIIALTAGALEGDRAEATRSGMNDYLTKPVKIEALQKALQRAEAAIETRA